MAPKDVADTIYKEITWLIRPDEYLFVKLNRYGKEETLASKDYYIVIKKIYMKNMECYGFRILAGWNKLFDSFEETLIITSQ